MSDIDRNDFIRKIAIRSGVVTCGLGLLFFFFANSGTASLTFWQKAISALVGFIACYLALVRYFRDKQF